MQWPMPSKRKLDRHLTRFIQSFETLSKGGFRDWVGQELPAFSMKSSLFPKDFCKMLINNALYKKFTQFFTEFQNSIFIVWGFQSYWKIPNIFTFSLRLNFQFPSLNSPSGLYTSRQAM